MAPTPPPAELVAADVDGVLAALTLEEKVSLLAGADAWHLPVVERLGMGALKMSDGPNGVRGAEFTGGPSSACFPCGTALAATWDVDLVERVGRELAAEARAKGAHVLLGPTVNMHRHPLGGRHFECLTEDPELAARLTVAYVRGVQAGGVAACVKHLVANDSEFERFTISSEVPEIALREVYLRPFEAAVSEAGALAVMAAYNRLHGTHCSEHRELLTTILRDEWGFEGIVVSDWGATHSTARALEAGLDVEMPGPPAHRGANLVAAVRSGEVGHDVVDESVRRVLRVAARTRVLDATAPGQLPQQEGEREDDTDERRALLRSAAAASIVLLRNDSMEGGRPLLPLDAQALTTVAVIGPNADVARIQGGGSAGVTPYRAASPLEALEARLGDGVRLLHEPGCTIARTLPRLDERLLATAGGVAGLFTELFAGPTCDGEPIARSVARRLPMGWNHDGSIRLSGTLAVRERGEHGLQLRTNGRAHVTVGDWSAGTGDGGRVELRVPLEAGVPYPIVIELAAPQEQAWRVGLDVRHRRPLPDDLLERAVRVAAEADVAIIVVGTDNDWETEGRDRASLVLPGDQDELVERVAVANPRTVVVVNSGAPVSMGWADRVPALLQLWFPGQEAGHALADVLFGDVCPSGRLPTTFPKRIEDTPAFSSYPGTDGRVVYEEGLLVGYRWYDAHGIEPRFPFGHGLSYTAFAYGELHARVTDDRVHAEIEVTNTGDVAGAEVVQLYVAETSPGPERPAKELKAFAKVSLEPGERRTVEFTLEHRAFARWDPATHAWVVDAGDRELLAGASAADIRASNFVALAVQGPVNATKNKGTG